MRREYKKCRETVPVGGTVEIPGNAEGVTVANFSVFGDSAQVSWLEPVGGDDRGVLNTTTVHATRSHYADDSEVKIPATAWAVSVYEPVESSETVVYYLQ